MRYKIMYKDLTTGEDKLCWLKKSSEDDTISKLIFERYNFQSYEEFEVLYFELAESVIQ